MKKIVAGIITVLGLTLIQSPAHAEVCSTGTISVSGINTFGQLPCTDPGTEINVTVRGLHDYGVSDGPTAYCSFNYVRRNLGTVASPNWSASTNTVCDPKPALTPTPTPTPTPTSTPTSVPTTVTEGQTIYHYGNGTSGTTPPTLAQAAVGGFAIVDPETNMVHGVIVGSIQYFGNNDKIMSQEYMGCPVGCKIILQSPSDPESLNVSGYNSNGSTVVTYNPTAKTFEVKDNGVLTRTITAPEFTQNDSGTVVTTLFVNFGAATDSGTVSATISGKEIVNNSESFVTEQSLFFEKSETEETVRIAASRLSILSAKIEKILSILNSWIS